MTQGQRFLAYVRERMREEVPDSIRIEGDALVLNYRFTMRGVETTNNDEEQKT